LYRRGGKRVVDLALSVLALVALWPVLLASALLVRLRLGRPILFRQKRPGLQAQPFSLYKFRTMIDGSDDQGNMLPDAERLTSLGRFLRDRSLDELPELYNVLRGDMSLVGPRPLLMEYLGRYSSTQARRMEVKPGITGWAQVNGRNALDWDAKFEHDVWYVDHLTFGLDMRILGLTLKKVFTKEGISHEGHVTMPGFKGTGS
jgi:sugar transferase EpsL